MKHTTRFLSALLALLMVVGLAVPTLAALNKKTIEVYTGVNIYVDDHLIQPKDANGNPVEVFVYNGTTYLPVRAVGEAVGKTVQWEGKTSSVYLGKHTGEKPAVWLQEMDYFTGSSIYGSNSESQRDNLGNYYEHVIDSPITNTYLLNGQYSAISGTFYQIYDYRSERDPLKITTLKIFGDDELLYSAEMNGGITPIDFYVDLTGVLKLTVDISGWTIPGYGTTRGVIGNCGLWT